jgi:hypothetical protein
MKLDDRLGTIEMVRATIVAELLPVFEYLRDMLHDISGRSTETASLRERALYYSLTGKK